MRVCLSTCCVNSCTYAIYAAIGPFCIFRDIRVQSGSNLQSKFERREAVLCSYFPNEHMGMAVAQKNSEMLERLKVRAKLQVILWDRGSNMVAGFAQAEIPSLPCLAHILQCSINEGLLRGKTNR